MKEQIVKELPENMTGHIVYFKDPLIVHQTKEIDVPNKKGWKQLVETGQVAKCHFMRVSGGFGAYACCSGRMLIGDFFKSIKDVRENKVFDSGNTKCYPDGYLPEFFTQNEPL